MLVGAGLGAETCAPVAGEWVRVELEGFCQSLMFQNTIRGGQKL